MFIRMQKDWRNAQSQAMYSHLGNYNLSVEYKAI